MILKFPDLPTLRLALTTGAVPPAVSQGPAVAGFDDGGACWVETPAALPRGSQNELKKLGVQVVRASGAAAKVDVSSWLEVLPLAPDPTPVERLEQTPVLFDLAGGEELARLVTEVLRLGNDRQAFRWLEGPKADGGARALLRVVGPPYYSLLRALDHIGQGAAPPVAFTERAPRVWVEVGYTHPLVARVQAPEGKLLLLRPPRAWELLPDGPFRDVYEVLEFPLRDKRVSYKDGKLKAQIRVTPALKPGGAPEGAELWVLRDDAVAELNRFVQNAPDDLLQRLAFAVGAKGGQTTIAVRVRPSKLPPPELVLKGDGYKHYLKLPNLFLPVGTALHPPLRRDQVRQLLADDPAQVTWLRPVGDGRFVPEGLPEDAFRPLWDWVDYVLDHDREALEAWVQAAQFDFEPFVCAEEQAARPKKAPPDRPKAPRSDRPAGREPTGKEDGVLEYADAADGKEGPAPLDEFGAVVKAEPSELQKRLKALEEEFLAYDGGLDADERQRLWPELATLHGAVGNADDAGVCWMNALWEREPAPAWLAAWFRAEAGAVRLPPGARPGKPWAAKAQAKGPWGVGGDDLDRLLGLPEPGTADLRALAAYLAWAGAQESAPAALLERLNPLGQFLEQHERLLPVRGVWLAWRSLTRLARGDVLGLARARDRLLERLYGNGVRPEQDLPSFLRFAGQPSSQRFRAARQWLAELNALAQGWVLEGPAAHAAAQTPAYVDLIFAFGLARLGEHDGARELLAKGRSVLGTKDKDAAHKALLEAYEYRVKQALEGASGGPLPDELLDRLERLEEVDKRTGRLHRYIVDKLRKHSRVLEPDQRINPYRHWGASINDLERALAELTDLTNKDEIARRVDKLLQEAPKGTAERTKVVEAGLEAAPRVGEEFAKRLLAEAQLAYDALPAPKEVEALKDQAKFLERALFVAGHYGRVEHVHPLVGRFQKMLQTQRGHPAVAALDSLAGQCFRGLRKLGMRDEIDQLLRQMADLVLAGKEPAQVDFQAPHGPAALRALLHVAAGWYYFGRDAQADPVLQAARALLVRGELPAREQTQLACAYAGALGEAPVEVAQKRLEELFKQLKGVSDNYTTSTHFSASRLELVEAVVLAVAGENFQHGAQARRWLDDDEFLVRRRVHADLRALMAAG